MKFKILPHTGVFWIAAFIAACSSPADSLDQGISMVGCDPFLGGMAETSSLGFSADEVVALLQGNLPSNISWEETATGSGAQDALAISLIEVNETELEICVGIPMTESAFKEDTEFLRIPLQIQISIADGQVSSEGVSTIYAITLDEADIYLTMEEGAEVSGDYAEAGQNFIQSETSTSSDVNWTGTRLWLDGSWLDASVVLSLEYQDAANERSVTANAWEGVWSE